MPFTPTTWVDGTTAITATELNRIETGIEDAHTGAVDDDSLAVTKLEWWNDLPVQGVGWFFLGSPTVDTNPSGVVDGTQLRMVHWTAAGAINIGAALIAGWTFMNLGPLTPAGGVSLFIRRT